MGRTATIETHADVSKSRVRKHTVDCRPDNVNEVALRFKRFVAGPAGCRNPHWSPEWAQPAWVTERTAAALQAVEPRGCLGHPGECDVCCIVPGDKGAAMRQAKLLALAEEWNAQQLQQMAVQDSQDEGEISN